MRSAQIQKLPLGKLLISSAAAAGMVGPYLFDWNETHIFNATWPPHAKFHNAQTMSSGVVLGLATLFQLDTPEDYEPDAEDRFVEEKLREARTLMEQYRRQTKIST